MTILSSHNARFFFNHANAPVHAHEYIYICIHDFHLNIESQCTLCSFSGIFQMSPVPGEIYFWHYGTVDTVCISSGQLSLGQWNISKLELLCLKAFLTPLTVSKNLRWTLSSIGSRPYPCKNPTSRIRQFTESVKIHQLANPWAYKSGHRLKCNVWAIFWHLSQLSTTKFHKV
jgi:hypothetical protein